jgi:hypothetical protein
VAAPPRNASFSRLTHDYGLAPLRVCGLGCAGGGSKGAVLGYETSTSGSSRRGQGSSRKRGSP